MKARVNNLLHFFSLVFVPCVRIKQSSKDKILYFFNIYILSACSDKALWLPANVRDAEESFSKYYWVCAECIYSYYNATAIDYEFITCKPSYQDFCTRKVYFCLGEDIQYSGCLAQGWYWREQHRTRARTFCRYPFLGSVYLLYKNPPADEFILSGKNCVFI